MPGEEKPIKESRPKFLLNLDNSPHRRAGPMILVGPSLQASPRIGDKIDL